MSILEFELLLKSRGVSRRSQFTFAVTQTGSLVNISCLQYCGFHLQKLSDYYYILCSCVRSAILTAWRAVLHKEPDRFLLKFKWLCRRTSRFVCKRRPNKQAKLVSLCVVIWYYTCTLKQERELGIFETSVRMRILVHQLERQRPQGFWLVNTQQQ